MDWCCICKRCGVSVDHLLRHCPISCELYNGVLFVWIPLGYAMGLLICFTTWQGSFGRHINIAFWKALPHSIMCCLWRKWNDRSFEGCEWSILEIKTFFYFLPCLVRLECCFPFPPLFFSFEHCNLRV